MRVHTGLALQVRILWVPLKVRLEGRRRREGCGEDDESATQGQKAADTHTHTVRGKYINATLASLQLSKENVP